MKSIFTNNDIKDMVKSIFAENDENVLFIDGEEQAEKSLLNYLNIEFYAWKDRVVENTEVDTNSFSPYNAWLESLNLSLNKSYALVQITNEEASITQDIDSSKIFAQIHFLVQSDKVSNLDYLIGKIRAKYIANPQKIQNCYGDELMGYFNFGMLYYDEEPFDTQIGEVMQVSVNFTLSYLTDALTYNDTPLYIKLEEDGTYMQVPYLKGTWQNMFTGQAVTCQVLPTRTGVVNSSATKVTSITFYDFNKDLTLALNDLFWEIGATHIGEVDSQSNPTPVTAQEVNIPVWVKVVSNGKYYIYKMLITDMQKDLTNSDFTVSSITLKHYGKR